MVHRIGLFKAMSVFEVSRATGIDAAAKMLLDELSPKKFGGNAAKSFNSSKDVFREAVWQTRTVEMDEIDPFDGDHSTAASLDSYSLAYSDDPQELIEKVGRFLVRRKFKSHPAGFINSAHLSMDKRLRFTIGSAQYGSTGAACRLFVPKFSNQGVLFEPKGGLSNDGYNFCGAWVLAAQHGLGRDREGRSLTRHGTPSDIIYADISGAARKNGTFLKDISDEILQCWLSSAVERVHEAITSVSGLYESVEPQLAPDSSKGRGMRAEEVTMFELFRRKPKADKPARNK